MNYAQKLQELGASYKPKELAHLIGAVRNSGRDKGQPTGSFYAYLSGEKHPPPSMQIVIDLLWQSIKES